MSTWRLANTRPSNYGEEYMTDRALYLPPRLKLKALMLLQEPHRWRDCIIAYLEGKTVQYRNNGCNENGGSAWYDLSDAMVEGKSFWACTTGAFGKCWDWSWMDFRIKPEVH